MSDKTEQKVTAASSVESTSVSYDEHALPTLITTSDGQASCMRFYTGADADGADRGDQLPDISTLIKGLELADGTALTTAAALQCPKIIDTRHPALMARLEYLEFEGEATSSATLTLCGYAHSTRDGQGRLMADTVLILEGVTVKSTAGEAKGWAVSLAESWSAIKVTLIQSVLDDTDKDALQSTRRTATTWYKDNAARTTRKLTETTVKGEEPGTWKVVSKAPLITGDEAILSQQIVSAFSGRLLRESRQDGDGKPERFICHEYDTRGRGTRSVTYPYDQAAFDKGDVSKLKALEEHRITWSDSGFGTWVTTSRADGRLQRTLYDGMQRAVRRELQRQPGEAGEFIVLEASTWGRGEAPEQVKCFDYLPGGLCMPDDREAQEPSQLRHHFWQAHAEPVASKTKDKEPTLTCDSVLGLMGGDIQFTQRHRQVNHAKGAVTQTFAQWGGHDSSKESTALRTEEKTDARGRKVQYKQHVPLTGSAVKSREWQTTWDDLDRPLTVTQPDESVVSWAYKGLSTVPVKVSISAKGGTEQVLGTQTLKGDGNQGDTVTASVVGGANGLAYSEHARSRTGPDGKSLFSSETDNGLSWYTKGKDDKSGTLLASFEYTPLTRLLKGERMALGNQQSKVTSEALTPLLLGGWRFDLTVHAQKQRQEALVSLRGQLQQVRHANGVSSRAWNGPQGQCNRVRRGALEYWNEYTALGECEGTTVRDLHSGRSMAVSYKYDQWGNEIERLYRIDDQTKVRYVQTWSVIGQLLSKTLYRDGSTTAARTEAFVYYTSVDGKRDELQKWTVVATAGNQIKDAAGNVLKEQSYKYDVLGNLIECRTTRENDDVELVSYAYADIDHPTRRTTQTTQLTPEGKQAGTARTQTFTYDSNGQLTCNEQAQTLAYSETGRLRSVTEKDQTTPVTYYEYDEHDRLISQWQATDKQRRVLAYSGPVLCGETWLDKSGKVSRTLTLDEHAGMVVKECQDAVETQLFVLGDPQQSGGDEFWLDADGAWQYRSLAFTPWGEAPLASLGQMRSGLGHNGQRVDPVTGCSHLGNGYRVYDPRHRAFYQRDSWSPFGEGGLNDRAYCAGGDPVNWHDPSGHIMLSRRDQSESLARLDSAITATKPPVHEAAPWWQWLLLGLYAITAIVVTILTFGAAGPIMAGVGMALCTGIMIGASLTAAGMAQRQSNPRLSSRLEGAGHIVMAVTSLPGMAAGLPAVLGGAVVAYTLASVAFDAARLAVEQDNPALAEKLGWGSTLTGAAAAAAAALPSIVRGAGRLLQKLRGLRSLLRRRVSAIAGEYALNGGSAASGAAQGEAYTLYSGGTNSGKLRIISHGKRVAGPMASGFDAPANFVSPWEAETNFFTQNGFRAVVRNDPADPKSLASFIAGRRPVVQTYRAGSKVSNYELRELVPNKASTEVIHEYERAPFRMMVETLAKKNGVDVVLVNRPVGLNEVLESLATKGYTYTSIDALHCRGSKLYSNPLVYRRLYGAYLTSLDGHL